MAEKLSFSFGDGVSPPTKEDMCEWLNSIGWIARNDAQWENITPLWSELAELRVENARLRQELDEARELITRVASNSCSDDGGMVSRFSMQTYDNMVAYLDRTSGE